MINQAHPYFYHLKDHNGELHSTDSGTNKRDLMRQLKRQMRGMDGPATADFFIVTEYREGGNRTKLTAQLQKDEEDKLKYMEL